MFIIKKISKYQSRLKNIEFTKITRTELRKQKHRGKHENLSQQLLPLYRIIVIIIIITIVKKALCQKRTEKISLILKVNVSDHVLSESVKDFKSLEPGGQSITHLSFLVFFIVAEELIINVLPQHREHKTLKTIGNDLGLQTTAEKAHDAVLCNHTTNGFGIGDLLVMRLTIHLNHSNGVGACVRHCR